MDRKIPSKKSSKSTKGRKKVTKVRNTNLPASIYKLEDGWYYNNKDNSGGIGPFRTRDLAREAKRGYIKDEFSTTPVLTKHNKEVLDYVGKIVEEAKPIIDAQPSYVEDLAREAKKRTHTKEESTISNIVDEVLTKAEEKKYLYKVVSEYDRKLYSASVPLSSALCLEYKEGEVTEVDRELFDAGFGICCFDSVENARKWRRYRQLWKVEVGETRIAASKRPSVSWLHYIPKNGFNVREILEKINANLARDKWPIGIVMASWVRLIEKV